MKRKIIIGFSLAVLMGLAVQTELMACDAKCQSAVKNYTKDIERAEQKDCNIQDVKNAKALASSCARALDKLDKRYDRFPDELKANGQIQALKQRHDTLLGRQDEIDVLVENSKFIDPYFRRISSAEKRNCTLKNQQLYAQCAQDLEKMQKTYEAIPGDKKNLRP